jgi:hypothetical protein
LFGLRPLQDFVPPQFANPAKTANRWFDGFAYSGWQNVANLERYVKYKMQHF